MGNLQVSIFLILTVIACSNPSFGQWYYRHKSEAKIAAMTPAQRAEEKVKSDYNQWNYDPDYDTMLTTYVREDGIKALPVLADIANRYNPNSRKGDEQVRKFKAAIYNIKDIDNVVIRIRATEEGRVAIKVFEDVLNRMKNAGFADPKSKWNRDYNFWLEDLEVLQGKRPSLKDGWISATLRKSYGIQMSEEEVMKFGSYLTLLDHTYPSRCKLTYPDLLCRDSKEYYEAYLKFKAGK